MKRLIYAPKVYIFIRSSNLGGRVYDVSSDVVSGSVTQNLNEVSTASFYLRNRYQKWIRDPSSGNRSIFLPMDLVTIWLQRVSGKPIQVFTGYLDSAPYYQAYPGDAFFEATCTLKKLAYTWFDPGLPFFQQWMMSTDGWTYDVSTGEAINPQYQLTGQPVTTAGPGTGQTASLNDGGFADLLGRFMTEIAGWSGDDILISSLPANIPKIAAKLYTNIETQTEVDLTTLSNFMSQALGVSGWGSPTTTQSTTSGGTAIQGNQVVSITGEIASVASQANVPTLVCIFAALCLSSLKPSFSGGPGKGVGNNWGYGLYALQPPNITSVSPLGGTTPGVTNQVGGVYATTIEGYTPEQLLDPSTSTSVFCKLLNQNPGSWVQGARNNNQASMVQWIELAIGRDLPSGLDLTSLFNQAKQLAQTSNVVVPTQSPSAEVDPSSVTWSDPIVQNLLSASPRDSSIQSKYYASSVDWMSALYMRAKTISPNIQLSTWTGQPNDSILFTGSLSDLKALFTSLQGTDPQNANIDIVQFQSSNTTSVLYQGALSSSTSSTPITGITAQPSLAIVESSKPPSGTTISGSIGGGTDTSATTTSATTASSVGQTPGGSTFEQMAAFSANAAFAANFSFPADYLLATNLTGDRALMNDTSCLDAVTQFCQASLRAYRSMPDGRFLAFYPDYFGAQRQAYWSIKNIEIIDFGIQLNDESLATHVYVIGDTFDGDGTISDYDEISTRGVATINQAFMLDSFIETYQPPTDAKGTATQQSLGRLSDAQAFLQHYGARPHEEEQPLIRNTFYEFLMAWQRFMQLWASQFATSASFTFQPEVMAGGLIAFPDHGIQMFCESVKHSFDYAQGFSTDATLSAPSLLPGAQPDRTHKPGFALAGNVNTVGLGA